MKSNLNRNRLVHPDAQVLRQLLKGFALATANRENPRAAWPGVVHGPSRGPMGLRPAVKHPCNPGHPERLPASRPRRKSSLCPAPRQGAVCCQVSS